ncbi:hypothetical protein TorRG33x02_112710 [Trema orientale]|uniref:Uncharacterized protein n=1 Tax=Trema orientale TaxID=63057 RepID=A0A2P5F5C2_TREOI|nr:hypothetical protein TorRG33x02_112710 [Trema orientale]
MNVNNSRSDLRRNNMLETITYKLAKKNRRRYCINVEREKSKEKNSSMVKLNSREFGLLLVHCKLQLKSVTASAISTIRERARFQKPFSFTYFHAFFSFFVFNYPLFLSVL